MLTTKVDQGGTLEGLQGALNTRKWSPRQILILGLCLIPLPLASALWKYKFDWWLYDLSYGGRLALPHDLHPFYEMSDIRQSVPGDRSLTVRIYKPETATDADFRSWVSEHNHSTSFRPTKSSVTSRLGVSLAPPFGVWEASSGSETLTFSRLSSSGWIEVSVSRRPTDVAKI